MRPRKKWLDVHVFQAHGTFEVSGFQGWRNCPWPKYPHATPMYAHTIAQKGRPIPLHARVGEHMATKSRPNIGVGVDCTGDCSGACSGISMHSNKATSRCLNGCLSSHLRGQPLDDIVFSSGHQMHAHPCKGVRNPPGGCHFGVRPPLLCCLEVKQPQVTHEPRQYGLEVPKRLRLSLHSVQLLQPSRTILDPTVNGPSTGRGVHSSAPRLTTCCSSAPSRPRAAAPSQSPVTTPVLDSGDEDQHRLTKRHAGWSIPDGLADDLLHQASFFVPQHSFSRGGGVCHAWCIRGLACVQSGLSPWRCATNVAPCPVSVSLAPCLTT